MSLNPNAKKAKVNPKEIQVKSLVQSLKNGDRNALAKAITLVESTSRNLFASQVELMDLVGVSSAKTMRIGFSGTPGAGKSTFIDAFGKFLVEKERKKVAVLAIDPSSKINGGSILGDKTRMSFLTNHENAFVRPSSSGNHLGGATLSTYNSILLCEAAGFDVVIIETLGVGQAEVEVAQMVDFYSLILVADSGDELQGIKRGVLEWAHAVLINKADGKNKKVAEFKRNQLLGTFDLFFPILPGWKSRVLTCSASENKGVQEFYELVVMFYNHIKWANVFKLRKEQEIAYFNMLINSLIVNEIRVKIQESNTYKSLVSSVTKSTVSLLSVCRQILDKKFTFQ